MVLNQTVENNILNPHYPNTCTKALVPQRHKDSSVESAKKKGSWQRDRARYWCHSPQCGNRLWSNNVISETTDWHSYSLTFFNFKSVGHRNLPEIPARSLRGSHTTSTISRSSIICVLRTVKTKKSSRAKARNWKNCRQSWQRTAGTASHGREIDLLQRLRCGRRKRGSWGSSGRPRWRTSGSA